MCREGDQLVAFFDSFSQYYVDLTFIERYNPHERISLLAPQLLETTFHVVLEDDGGFSLYTTDPEAVDKLWDILLAHGYMASPAMDRLLGSGIRFAVVGAAPRPLKKPH